MELFTYRQPLPDGLDRPVILAALDGWTDAGQAGTLAAQQLRDEFPSTLLGAFDSDQLYDYRDRRPLLDIERGILGDPEWPALELWHIAPPDGPDLLLVTGAEPDLSWRRLSDAVVSITQDAGATRYVGLGAVPGPVPHTRPVRLISTSSDIDVLEQLGRPHEQVIVPASCQVVLETALRDAGVVTVGLWARIPHYVAGEYPAGAQTLLLRTSEYLDFELDTTSFDSEVIEHRTKLDVAAAGSPEISTHIEQLEELYDDDLLDDQGLGGPLPTGDQIAAEFERFLRDEQDGD
ncbi:MAG: PAC2 family protein [Nitriliruptorales bacterium]|nr:PAC2 family protein [Nitriliruptorales bacterium]